MQRNISTHCGNGHEFTSENTYIAPKTSYRMCVTCRREYAKKNQKYHPEKARISRAKWREQNPDYHKNHWMERKYGLTREQYDSLIEKQSGKCIICLAPFTDVKLIHIDHDHTTNKVRALLCNLCNQGLGQFKDNPEALIRAAEYVKLHKEI